MILVSPTWIAMEFPKRLADLRKQRGMTQQQLADVIGIHVSQLRRYEGGASQPTLEVIKNLALALRVSADQLIFDTEERGPDDLLRIQFEAVKRLDPQEKQVVLSVLEGLLIKHDAKKWMRSGA